ncbi:hypothetical protein LLH03_01660 [bacterium]|nr:hypothetical protein [bacterium]
MRRDEAQSKFLFGAIAVCLAIAVGVAVMLATNKWTYAVAGSVAALGTIAALASTEAALYTIITIACFDGLIKGMSPGMASMVLKDAYLGLAMMRWVWEGVNNQPRQSLSSSVALPAFLFTAYCVGQMFNTETMSWMLALAGLRSWVIWIPIYFITYDTIRTRRQFERMLLFIAVISAGTGVYGVIQHQIGFDHLSAVSPNFGFYDHFRRGSLIRAPGTYVHPGTAGAAMSFAATVCAGVALASRAFSMQQISLLAAAPICLTALAATGSRSPLIGGVVGLIVFVAMTRQVRLFVGMAVLVAIGMGLSERQAGLAVSQRYTRQLLGMQTVISRAIGPLYKAGDLLSRFPLGTGIASGTGVGRSAAILEQPLYVSEDASAFIENELGRAMKEMGLPGVSLLIWLLWRAMKSGFVGWKLGTGRDRWLASGLMAGAVNLAVQNMSGSALYLAPGGIYFWMACALAARVPDYEATDREEEVPDRSEEEAAEWDKLATRSQQRRPLPPNLPSRRPGA